MWASRVRKPCAKPQWLNDEQHFTVSDFAELTIYEGWQPLKQIIIQQSIVASYEFYEGNLHGAMKACNSKTQSWWEEEAEIREGFPKEVTLISAEYLGEGGRRALQVVAMQYAKVLGGRDVEELRQERLHDSGGAIETRVLWALQVTWLFIF